MGKNKGIPTKASLGDPRVSDERIKTDAETTGNRNEALGWFAAFRKQYAKALSTMGEALTTTHDDMFARLFLLAYRPKGKGKSWGLMIPVGNEQVSIRPDDAARMLNIEGSRQIFQGMLRLCAAIATYYQANSRVIRLEQLKGELADLRKHRGGYGGVTVSSLRNVAKADHRFAEFFATKAKSGDDLATSAYNKIGRWATLMLLSPEQVAENMNIIGKGALSKADAGVILASPAQVRGLADLLNKVLERANVSAWSTGKDVLTDQALTLVKRERPKAAGKGEAEREEILPMIRALNAAMKEDLGDEVDALIAASCIEDEDVELEPEVATT